MILRANQAARASPNNKNQESFSYYVIMHAVTNDFTSEPSRPEQAKVMKNHDRFSYYDIMNDFTNDTKTETNCQKSPGMKKKERTITEKELPDNTPWFVRYIEIMRIHWFYSVCLFEIG